MTTLTDPRNHGHAAIWADLLQEAIDCWTDIWSNCLARVLTQLRESDNRYSQCTVECQIWAVGNALHLEWHWGVPAVRGPRSQSFRLSSWPRKLLLGTPGPDRRPTAAGTSRR